MKAVYLATSVTVFAAAVGLHVISYSRDAPRWWLSAMQVSAVLLCVPLVALFLRTKKVRSPEDLWLRFWNAVIERCPRWIWGYMSLAWFVAMFTFVRGIFFTHDPQPMTFHSALILMPISAALSYSVTLWRCDEKPA